MLHLYLYLPHLLVLQLWSQNLRFVAQYREHRVADQHAQTQGPDEGDGVEEVCVPGAGGDPDVVEGGAEEGGV